MRLMTAPADRAGETDAAIAGGLLDARVTHVRHAETRYQLSHRLWYLRVPVDALPSLPWPWLGYNRPALVTLRDRDYGRGDAPMRDWIDEALRAGGFEPPGGRIDLVTLPRVAGMFFNPVSFWLAHDGEGRLRAVVAEVNNTFGERHCYVCRKPDGGVIEGHDEITARKLLYVSPFLAVEGEYRFRFHETADRLGIFINLMRDGRTVLYASIAGRLAPLTPWGLARRLARQPLPAARVLALIHLHAARLYLRGLRLKSRPRGERALISVGQLTSHTLSEAKCPRPATFEH